MRIQDKNEEINYSNTLDFFINRAKKYSSSNPYATTMYNDNHPELVKERNEIEVEKLLPQLRLDSNSKILDVSCGIGRWAEAIKTEIKSYCGIDFCEDFIELAKKRITSENKKFFVAKSTEITQALEKNKLDKVNRVIVIGGLMYLNDTDLENCLSQIENCCEKNAIILIREPIGLETRLTLKEEFSEELDDSYSAVYRTESEYISFFQKAFVNKGFAIVKKDFLFEDSKLNNRKETAQFYFIIERKGR
ncbi:MAG: class I SAM-dependent methyltransferase [Treponema sp.]|nr:class I SAM-dependent methyltransferase [Treponema sp.]